MTNKNETPDPQRTASGGPEPGPDPTPKKAPRKVTPKTIVMQMEVKLRCEGTESETGRDITEVYGTGWKDMTGEDFGDPKSQAAELVQVFKDSAEAKCNLRAALELGQISGGTFRVAACGKSITPTVQPKTQNVVTM